MKKRLFRESPDMVKRYADLILASILLLLLSAGLIAACGTSERRPEPLADIKTELLVRAPDGPLPLNKSIEVKSRTEAQDGVSHVDLYLTLPTNQEVLARSDAAAFGQTTFITSQMFTPKQTGHYVIKVVGYNKEGTPASSNSIGFDVQ
jgi:hypothetical protein